MKTCSRCGIEKPLEEFHRSKKGKAGRTAACKACRKKAAADAYKRDREKIQARNHAWRRANPDRVSGYSRKFHIQRYGITLDQWEQMFTDQGESCAICGARESGSKGWATDHDHSCCPYGAKCCGDCVRGILCSNCNIGLGKFRDDVNVLESAIEYLTAN